MADTSRKRSRKSKLVPRECCIGEEDLELQIPETILTKAKRKKKKTKRQNSTTTKTEDACDTSVLKKINASARGDIQTPLKTSPRKFEINIEVESCDDDDGVAEREEKVYTSPKKVGTHPIVEKVLRPVPIMLSLDNILTVTDNIVKNSTNVADKYLDIYVKNTVGYEQRQTLSFNWLDNQIQQVLDEWKTWQFRSYHREDPLFYKCYICTKSWWFLSDFRNHMFEEHGDDMMITIALEKYEMHEVNLIAYHKRLVVIKDIYTEGLCYRCGRDYAAHELGLRFQQKYYRNDGCNRQFHCCMGLRDHLPCCPMCKVQSRPLKCDICKSRYNTQEEIRDHLVLSHSVRSDVPIMSRYLDCKSCSERYSCGIFHKCGQRTPVLECPYCIKCFPKLPALEVHVKSLSEQYPCEICKKVLTHSCKIFEHMLTHTANYKKVRKCLICDGLNVFINKDDARAHRRLKHPYTKHQNYFPKLIVPSAYVYQRLTDSDSIELQLVPKKEPIEEETVPEISVQEELLPEKSVVEDLVPEISVQEELLPEKSVEEDLVPDKLVPEELVLKTEEDLEDQVSEFIMENLIVKEEPEDYIEQEELEDSPRLVIKEEQFEEFESKMLYEENCTENFEHQVNVKEECIEDEDIYGDDLIKLNFEEDLIEKQNANKDKDGYTVESQTSDDQTVLQQPIQEGTMTPDSESGTKTYRCKMCNFDGNHREYQKHIKSVKHHRKSNYVYKCTKCFKGFISINKYLAHLHTHGYKKLSCPECLKSLNTFTSLAKHVHTHVKQNFVRVKLISHIGTTMSKSDYQCKKCLKHIGDVDFFAHWELHVNDHPTHPVRVTSRPETSTRHGELHETVIKDCIAQLTKTPKECNHCHHKFNRANECKRHIIEHLLTDAYNQKNLYMELKCQICGAGFFVADKYKEHMREHASLPVYKCELCDRAFSDSSNFTKHKKVHNLRVLMCDICQKKFQNKTSLAKHIEKHQGTEPIVCKLCGRVFYFESTHRRHIRYFHDKVAIGYRCVVCGERFHSLKLKWDHMWKVHNERKQKADCPICRKSFRKYSDVRAHAKAEHLTEVSVVSVKDSNYKKVNINRYLKSANSIKVGRVETLVVYDSE